jgi:hypothetical protein
MANVNATTPSASNNESFHSFMRVTLPQKTTTVCEVPAQGVRYASRKRQAHFMPEPAPPAFLLVSNHLEVAVSGPQQWRRLAARVSNRSLASQLAANHDCRPG